MNGDNPTVFFHFMLLRDVIVPHLSTYGKTKKTAWAIWSIYPKISEAFVFIVENTFTQTDYTAQFFSSARKVHCCFI